jgi:peroxiredoxin
LANYRDHYGEFLGAGCEVVAISVDDASRSAAIVKDLDLPFQVLCDTRRAVVTQWGLLNAKEKGGIAYPACFVIDRERRVRYRCVEGGTRRADAKEVAAYVRALAAGASAPEPAMAKVGPGRLFLRAIQNAVLRGVRSPSSTD